MRILVHFSQSFSKEFLNISNRSYQYSTLKDIKEENYYILDYILEIYIYYIII